MNQNAQTPSVFYLLNDLSPETWSLSQKDVLVKNPKTGFLEKIYYIPGANTIWHSELEKQGDILKNYKKKSIFFVEGTLSVSPDDIILIQYLKTHPDFSVKYSLVDKNADAQKSIDKADLIIEALNSLQGNTLDIKTVGLLVFGESVLLQDDKEIEAVVKQSAISNPQAIVDAYSDKGEWKYKKVVALALSKGIIKINPTKTAVLWTESGEPILTLAVGQKPIDETGVFLSENKNETTLQALSLKLNKSVAGSNVVSTTNKGDESSLEKMQKEYEDKFGSIPPINKKNDVEWLAKKLLEPTS
nr:hypothetical protein [uncultured Flavobacterium sp.]